MSAAFLSTAIDSYAARPRKHWSSASPGIQCGNRDLYSRVRIPNRSCLTKIEIAKNDTHGTASVRHRYISILKLDRKILASLGDLVPLSSLAVLRFPRRGQRLRLVDLLACHVDFQS